MLFLKKIMKKGEILKSLLNLWDTSTHFEKANSPNFYGFLRKGYLLLLLYAHGHTLILSPVSTGSADSPETYSHS